MNNIAAERAGFNATVSEVNVSNATKGDSIHLQQNQREVAQYISDMILELRNMAKTAKLHKVMVPLEFAYYEAFTVANKVDIPQEEIERLKELSKVARQYEDKIA